MRIDFKYLNIYISDVGFAFDILGALLLFQPSSATSRMTLKKNQKNTEFFNILSSLSNNIL